MYEIRGKNFQCLVVVKIIYDDPFSLFVLAEMRVDFGKSLPFPPSNCASLFI